MKKILLMLVLSPFITLFSTLIVCAMIAADSRVFVRLVILVLILAVFKLLLTLITQKKEGA